MNWLLNPKKKKTWFRRRSCSVAERSLSWKINKIKKIKKKNTERERERERENRTLSSRNSVIRVWSWSLNLDNLSNSIFCLFKNVSDWYSSSSSGKLLSLTFRVLNLKFSIHDRHCQDKVFEWLSFEAERKKNCFFFPAIKQIWFKFTIYPVILLLYFFFFFFLWIVLLFYYDTQQKKFFNNIKAELKNI